MHNTILVKVFDAFDDGRKSIKYLLLRVLDYSVVSPALLDQGTQCFCPLGEDGPILIQNGTQQIGMGKLWESDDLGWELLKGIGLSGAFVKKEDIVGLVANQAEGVEIVQVHEFAVVHNCIISLYKDCDKLNKRQIICVGPSLKNNCIGQMIMA